jgi:hypothetical protein
MRLSRYATALALSALACQPAPSLLAPSDRPTPTPVLVPTSSPGQVASLCRPSDVVLSPGRQGAAAGTSYIAVDVALAGTDPCLWPKWPATELRDAQGAVIARAAKDGTDSIPLVASLNLEFGWSSWCLPPPNAPLLLAVALPAGEATVTLPTGFGASCMDVPTRISLQVIE